MHWFSVLLVALVSVPFNVVAQHQSAEFEFDHVLLFVQEDGLEDSLIHHLFTPAEKLTTAHTEQGTLGKYFLFYNTYIELLYLKDKSKAIENENRFKSAYVKRWETGGCPLSFGLSLTPFDTTLTPYKFNTYSSLDAPKNEYYLMSAYNTSYYPMLYVSMPDRAYRKYDSFEQIDQVVEADKREDVKRYLTHPSGIKRLTQVIVTTPHAEADQQNIQLLQSLANTQVINGDQYALTLVFDEGLQGKEYHFNGSFELIIRY